MHLSLHLLFLVYTSCTRQHAVHGAQIALQDRSSEDAMDTLPMLNVSAASAGSARWKFDDEPSPDAAMNYLFETAASLLQQWPNTRYRNGMS